MILRCFSGDADHTFLGSDLRFCGCIGVVRWRWWSGYLGRSVRPGEPGAVTAGQGRVFPCSVVGGSGRAVVWRPGAVHAEEREPWEGGTGVRGRSPRGSVERCGRAGSFCPCTRGPHRPKAPTRRSGPSTVGLWGGQSSSVLSFLLPRVLRRRTFSTSGKGSPPLYSSSSLWVYSAMAASMKLLRLPCAPG